MVLKFSPVPTLIMGLVTCLYCFVFIVIVYRTITHPQLAHLFISGDAPTGVTGKVHVLGHYYITPRR